MSKVSNESPWLPDDAELRSRATFKMFAYGLCGGFILLCSLIQIIREGTVPAWSSGTVIAGMSIYWAWQERRQLKR